MNENIFMQLQHQKHCGLPYAEDEKIQLYVKRIHLKILELGNTDSVIFDIVEKSSGKTAGEIALRLGEDAALYYLGHIGYHVDAPYRGNHFARRACHLAKKLFVEMGVTSVVLTTDVDNYPSIRTCEALGCILESTVNVPVWYIREFEISSRKRRYILFIA